MLNYFQMSFHLFAHVIQSMCLARIKREMKRIKYDGHCMTNQGLAWRNFDYDWTEITEDKVTGGSCRDWCAEQLEKEKDKPTDTKRNYVACDYDETHCHIIEDAVISGGDGAENAHCLVWGDAVDGTITYTAYIT